ncbi:glycosyltransferase [Neobacillus sp. PS3-40]|uniref:glycosyltransferase family 2 protein n=1 Tax=Neobacillus sp. PS3-40 TaxID=3070679 RepID=UPI0027E1D120|nr:glycosyltransferase [Neobacillus sp. PS3-40]WML45813.1 glycosyltransferase [Neobacillus sp. PS3-40]
MEPVISIIVPVYNTEQYLKKCIDSILKQTFTNFEIIIVNDGSTDKSGSISDEYATKDNRVKVIHKRNGGLSSARNAGIKIAKGEFIGFVDGDDYIDVNMYYELYRLCRETESDISICKFEREIKGKLTNKIEAEFNKVMDNQEAMRQLFLGNLYRFSVCNKLFRKTCFDNILFPEGRIHEDLSTTYKLFSNSNKAVYTNYKGYVYVKRENSILTSKFNEKRLDAFIGWEEILSFMNQNYPKLSREFISCFAYSSVDNIFYILDQVENKEKRGSYLFIIQRLVRKYYKQILKNDSLSIRYKFILSLINYSFILLFCSNSSRKLLSRMRLKFQ